MWSQYLFICWWNKWRDLNQMIFPFYDDPCCALNKGNVIQFLKSTFFLWISSFIANNNEKKIVKIEKTFLNISSSHWFVPCFYVNAVLSIAMRCVFKCEFIYLFSDWVIVFDLKSDWYWKIRMVYALHTKRKSIIVMLILANSVKSWIWKT